MKKLISILTVIFFITSCSTAGGFYKKDDAEHGEFSVGNTVLGVVGVVGVVLGVKKLSEDSGGGNSYTATGYAWDYQPGNNQWVCRNKSNGQYAYKQNCNGLPYVDNWP